MHNLPAIEQQLALLGAFNSEYIGVLAMGVFYGLTLCSFSCLPMLTPYLFAAAGGNGGFMPAFNLTAIFIITRVVAYAALGAGAGAMGSLILGWLDQGVFLPLAGAIVIGIGVFVMFSRRKGCARPRPASRGPRWRRTAHMVGLGMATSLMPCLPLSAILMLAASRGSMLQGAVLGLLFGIGAAASPLYYLGGATGWLATRIRAEIPKYSHGLQKLSGFILALFGLRLILSWGMT
jgi:cytochrome c biogenesis protein CcdA